MFTKRTILAALAVCSVAIVGCKSGQELTYPALSGHRGANAIAPENTLASIDSCIKYGIEYAECDVIISKDSVFYILHDSTLNRTTNGEGGIASWMSADIDTLDAGSWFGEEFKGQKVPRFVDVLRKAKRNNLKLTVDYRTGDYKKLVELIKQEDMFESCTYVFYSTDIYKEFKAANPDVNTLQAYIKDADDYEAVKADLDPDIVVVWMKDLTSELSAKIKADGKKVLVLALGRDNDAVADFQQAAELGAEIIATDLPEVMARSRK